MQNNSLFSFGTPLYWNEYAPAELCVSVQFDLVSDKMWIQGEERGDQGQGEGERQGGSLMD